MTGFEPVTLSLRKMQSKAVSLEVGDDGPEYSPDRFWGGRLRGWRFPDVREEHTVSPNNGCLIDVPPTSTPRFAGWLMVVLGSGFGVAGDVTITKRHSGDQIDEVPRGNAVEVVQLSDL